MEANYKIDHKISAKSEDLIYHLHEYDIDIKSNHIYLMGVDRGYEVVPDGIEPGVDFHMANRFIRNLNLCMRVNQDKPILIHLKTNGGDYIEGMAIYDAIRSCPSPIVMLNYTHARSMSSIIFQAAETRVMMPNSHFMFHMGELGLSGTQKQVASQFAFYDKVSTDTMLDIYAERMKESGKMSKNSIATIKKWLTSQMDKKEDVFLTAKETVELGLADRVFDYDWSSLYK